MLDKLNIQKDVMIIVHQDHIKQVSIPALRAIIHGFLMNEVKDIAIIVSVVLNMLKIQNH